ncbi:hypothetical protein BT69DRAFT_809399 [Atractiella rhizophila]|nr:hypothetical protein BT69DRAFT_809399 [Atractiella rhizophila]
MCLAWLKGDPKTWDKIYPILPVGGIAVLCASPFVSQENPLKHCNRTAFRVPAFRKGVSNMGSSKMDPLVLQYICSNRFRT